MDDYLRKFLDSDEVYCFNDNRSIPTDRMDSQNVDLIWEFAYDSKISATPDEVEVLYKKGKTRNVSRDFSGRLHMNEICCDYRSFPGAIVCGILSPSTNLRTGILDYAKKMGYISDTMVPVEMFNGTKSLTCHTDGTYTVTFKWSENVEKNADLENFTKAFWEHELTTHMRYFGNGNKSCSELFYKNARLVMEADGFCICGLVEQEVFSRDNIDAFRTYDIQLDFLNFDKSILFKAILQFGFGINNHYNLELLYRAYKKEPKLYTLPSSQSTTNISGKQQAIPLKCGTVYFQHSEELNVDYLTYKSNVPYSERVRILMKNFEKIAKSEIIEGTYCSFNPYNQTFEFEFSYVHESLKNVDKAVLRQQALRDLITLDYSIYILEKYKGVYSYHLCSYILKLFSRDANFSYEDTFKNYFEKYLKLLEHKD